MSYDEHASIGASLRERDETEAFERECEEAARKRRIQRSLTGADGQVTFESIMGFMKRGGKG